MKKLFTLLLLSTLSMASFAGEICVVNKLDDLVQTYFSFYSPSGNHIVREYVLPRRTECFEIPNNTYDGGAQIHDYIGNPLCDGLRFKSGDQSKLVLTDGKCIMYRNGSIVRE